MNMRWLLIGLFVFAASVFEAAAQDRMSVQIREGQLREQPSFLGRVVATAEYGERVSVQETRGPWRRVRVRGEEGWIHESALTSRRVVLEPGEEDVGPAAARDELALAGKGFSEEVEQEFRVRHRDADFSWVDRMEREWDLSMDEIARFLREGGLEGEEP